MSSPTAGGWCRRGNETAEQARHDREPGSGQLSGCGPGARLSACPAWSCGPSRARWRVRSRGRPRARRSWRPAPRRRRARRRGWPASRPARPQRAAAAEERLGPARAELRIVVLDLAQAAVHRLAQRVEAVDQPGPRAQHAEVLERLGRSVVGLDGRIRLREQAGQRDPVLAQRGVVGRGQRSRPAAHAIDLAAQHRSLEVARPLRAEIMQVNRGAAVAPEIDEQRGLHAVHDPVQGIVEHLHGRLGLVQSPDQPELLEPGRVDERPDRIQLGGQPHGLRMPAQPAGSRLVPRRVEKKFAWRPADRKCGSASVDGRLRSAFRAGRASPPPGDRRACPVAVAGGVNGRRSWHVEARRRRKPRPTRVRERSHPAYRRSSGLLAPGIGPDGRPTDRHRRSTRRGVRQTDPREASTRTGQRQTRLCAAATRSFGRPIGRVDGRRGATVSSGPAVSGGSGRK
jgi:hypothetical protein